MEREISISSLEEAVCISLALVLRVAMAVAVPSSFSGVAVVAAVSSLQAVGCVSSDWGVEVISSFHLGAGEGVNDVEEKVEAAIFSSVTVMVTAMSR